MARSARDLPPDVRPPTAPLLGIRVFGLGLILTSLLQMRVLADAERYWYLFQDWPAASIPWRYAASWAARLVGLVAGVGVLRRQEWARKAVVGLAVATFLTAHWKHPYAGFARHLEDLAYRSPAGTLLFQLVPMTGLDHARLTWTMVIIARAQEMALALLLGWYFTRPRVKARFAPDAAA